VQKIYVHAVSSDICKQARASQFVVAPPAETPVRVTVRDTVAMSHGNPFDIDDDAFEVWTSGIVKPLSVNFYLLIMNLSDQ
jgi:hypothetical protein